MTENKNELPSQPFRELPAAEAQDLAAMVRTLVANEMEIESIQTTRDQRQGAVMVQGRLLKPSHELFPRWLAELNARGFTPMLRPRPDRDAQEVTLQVLGGVAPKKRSNPWIKSTGGVAAAIGFPTSSEAPGDGLTWPWTSGCSRSRCQSVAHWTTRKVAPARAAAVLVQPTQRLRTQVATWNGVGA